MDTADYLAAIFIGVTLGLIGILMGSSISHKTDSNTLKPASGWFTLLMGIYILVRETVL